MTSRADAASTKTLTLETVIELLNRGLDVRRIHFIARRDRTGIGLLPRILT